MVNLRRNNQLSSSQQCRGDMLNQDAQWVNRTLRKQTSCTKLRGIVIRLRFIKGSVSRPGCNQLGPQRKLEKIILWLMTAITQSSIESNQWLSANTQTAKTFSRLQPALTSSASRGLMTQSSLTEQNPLTLASTALVIIESPWVFHLKWTWIATTSIVVKWCQLTPVQRCTVSRLRLSGKIGSTRKITANSDWKAIRSNR